MIVASVCAAKIAIMRLVDHVLDEERCGQALGVTPDGRCHWSPINEGWPWPSEAVFNVWRQGYTEGYEPFTFERVELIARGRKVYVYQLTEAEAKRWAEGKWRLAGENPRIPHSSFQSECEVSPVAIVERQKTVPG
jgi:hypothetical protein